MRAIVSRIGPKFGDILGDHPVAEALVRHFDDRGGHLDEHEHEGDRRSAEIAAMVDADFATIGIPV